jgi:ATP-dependent DNA helicase DinG
VNAELEHKVAEFFSWLRDKRSDLEEREGQVQLSRWLASHHALGQIAIAEAGTGTGKSYAYLLPLLLSVHEQKFAPVVATATIHLQEQLADKDIPELWKLVQEFQRATQKTQLDRELRSVVLIGRSNFVSLRRARFAISGTAQKQPGNFSEDEEILRTWLDHTKTGRLSEISIGPELREAVESQSDNCLGKRCVSHKQCFYFAHREQARTADLIVTNHAMVATDLARRKAGVQSLLPRQLRIVFDEAHNLGTSFRDHLGIGLSSMSIQRAVSKLETPKKSKGKRGRVRPLQRLLEAPLLLQMTLPDSTIEQLPEQIKAIQKTSAAVHHELTEWERKFRKNFSQTTRVLDASAELRFLQEITDPLIVTLSSVETGLTKLLKDLGPLFEAQQNPLHDPLFELQSIELKLSSLRTAFQEILWKPTHKAVRYVEQRARSVALHLLPLEFGAQLSEFLWNAVDFSWLTSATIQSQDGFVQFESTLGLSSESSCEAAIEASCFESPFDWEKQAELLIDPTAPPPTMNAEFEHYLILTIAKLAQRYDGRMFVLMTNAAQLARLRDGLHLALGSINVASHFQGDRSRKELLSDFRASKGVLFGLQSFWEGVDVQGKDLETVVIPRIPFPALKEPWNEAYQELLEQQGKQPFREFMLPKAILRLQQGAGRLIRTRQDTGRVIILDSRISSKSYGKTLMRMLPDMPVRDLELSPGEQKF